MEELITAYDQTGLKTMIPQEFIDWDDYVRCICIGREHVMPIRYNPQAPFEARYQISQPVEGTLRDHATTDARTLVEAPADNMDIAEFAITGDVLSAIDC